METIDELKNENNKLKNENIELKTKLEDTIKHLQKYTNGDRHKRYYEKNKDAIKQNGTNYKIKLKEENPDKLKEYAHRAYLKQKEKLKKQKEENKEKDENI